VISAGNERWVGGPLANRLAPAWARFGAGCALLVLAYYAAPSLGLSGLPQGLTYTGLSALATGALTVAIFVRKPAVWPAWALLAAGQFVYTIGDAAYAVINELSGDVPYPSVADGFYLAAYPLLAAGLMTLVRRRTPGWHLPTMVDAAIVGSAAALLWWIYLLSPLIRTGDESFATLLVTTAYPIMDLLVLVVALRLTLGAGSRPVAYHLLLASMALMLAADVVYALRSAGGTWQDYTWVDGLWLASYALLGCAALHPSMRRLEDRSAVAAPDAGVARLTALALASLTGPTVLLVEHVRGHGTNVPVVAVACAVMFLLVLGRMAGLVAAQRHEAMTDGLTELYTRRFFEENLRVETERAHRSGGQLGLLLVDVDHFKAINDTHGHPGGDRVLVELARRLRAISRPGDIVARFGGEEFALLLPGAGPMRAAGLAERVRRFVEATPFLVGEAGFLPLTVSVGVAVLPDEAETPLDLVRAADQALYSAKRAGRNQVALLGSGQDGLHLPRQSVVRAVDAGFQRASSASTAVAGTGGE